MIRQFILDDKGYVVICGWGLPSFAQKNSEQLAVTTALAFSNSTQLGKAENVNVGITFGRVYCGQVGGKLRAEYSMVGDTVNTAARLMASKASPILVDFHVKTSTASRYLLLLLLPLPLSLCLSLSLSLSSLSLPFLSFSLSLSPPPLSPPSLPSSSQHPTSYSII